MKSPFSFSFELFPPRTPEAQAKLPATIAQLAAVRPDYFSVTHGAGGSDQEGTYETLLAVVEHSGSGGRAASHLCWLDARRMWQHSSSAIAKRASSASWRCAAICRRRR